MRLRSTIACAALAVAAVAAPAGGPAGGSAAAATRYLDATFGVDVQHDVVYGHATAIDGTSVTLTLDLYTPRGDSATERPVFVFAHGGFFVAGDKAASTPVHWATLLAQRGYVTASISYRLGPVAVLAPVDTALERQIIDDARADMQTAVRWLRTNAASLGVDADRIAVGGVSAGAVTALGVALGADTPLPGDHADVSSAVCGAVSISGANEPAAVGPNDAGALFFHGTIDTVVPYPQYVATRAAMQAVGLPVAWIDFPGEGHSLTDESRAAMEAPTVQWLYEHVATATFPCSPAMAVEPLVPAGRQTPIAGPAGRSGVVSLVAVDNQAAGYVQALPCGQAGGASSNLNLDAVGQIRSVLAVVAFDGGGAACLFNQMRTHLVADLQGWFAPGAFDDVVDARVLDTRVGPRPGAGTQTMLAGRPDSTAVVSLVATENAAPGFVQVLSCGEAPGGASNLNVDAPAQTRATLAVVRFDAAGHACVFAQPSTHLVVDLQGYLAPAAVDDVDDTRVIDTRSGPRPGDGATIEIAGRPDTTAVVMIVATDTSGAGYVQALPCGTNPGSSSNLNVDRAGQTIAGLAFVRFDATGRACLFTQRATHLVADVQGYLTDGAFVDVPDERILDTRTRVR